MEFDLVNVARIINFLIFLLKMWLLRKCTWISPQCPNSWTKFVASYSYGIQLILYLHYIECPFIFCISFINTVLIRDCFAKLKTVITD